MQKIVISQNISALQELIPQGKQIFVIIDNNLKEYFPFFEKYHIIPIENGEEFKNLSTIEKITERLLKSGADRKSFIIGVGGGITTDMAGFAASIYKRGVKFGFAPTTLLAMCDASIGGKNGVNFGGLKNMIGTITQPEWVFISPALLKTLPLRQIKAGAAEALKTFLIYDGQYYSRAVELFAHINEGGEEALEEEPVQEELLQVIHKCAGYKSAVVERDMYEQGERRLLNLGHTFAHGIESCCTATYTDTTPESAKIMHGEAVAIGMIYAARVAEQAGLAEEGLAERLERDFIRCGLPTSTEGLPVSHKAIAEAMTKDKKVDSDKIHLILPCRPGKVIDQMTELTRLEEFAAIK